MGFKDFLKRGTGLDLVSGSDLGQSKQGNVGKQSVKLKKFNSNFGGDGKEDKILKQLEIEVSKSIEKLEDLRDKLRVRRGF